MKTITELEKIFNNLDAELTAYYNKSVAFSNQVNKNYSLIYKYWNERTLAAFAHHELSTSFDGNIEYSALEYSLFLSYPILPYEREAISIETTGSKKYVDNKTTFIPDGYIFTNDGVEKNSYYFEYKIDNRFSFVKLTRDFVKFKIYSSKNVTHNYLDHFIYVILHDERKLTTTVLKNRRTGKVGVKLLSCPISKCDINSDFNVYVYTNKVPLTTVDDIEAIDNVVSKIDESCNILVENNLDNMLDDSVEDNIYYHYKGGLGRNVSTSLTIRRYFTVIEFLYKHFSDESCNFRISDEVNPFRNPILGTNDSFYLDLFSWFTKLINGEKMGYPDGVIDDNITYKSNKRSSIIVILLYKYITTNVIDFDWNKTPFFRDFENVDETLHNKIPMYQKEYFVSFESKIVALVYYLYNLLTTLYKDVENGIESDAILLEKQKSLIRIYLKTINKYVFFEENDKSLYAQIDTAMKAVIINYLKE